MGYVALKTLDLGIEVRHAGELVPEAAFWPNVNSYISAGWLAFVPDESIDMAARLVRLEAKVNELAVALGLETTEPPPQPEVEAEPEAEPAPVRRKR